MTRLLGERRNECGNFKILKRVYAKERGGRGGGIPANGITS